MRPRKWSDKSRIGALRIPREKSSSQALTVDPFEDYSAAFMRHKTAQGQEFRRRKRDSDRWKRRQLELEKQRTQVSACKVSF